MEIGYLVFLGNNKKAKCFTVFFGMPAVMDVVGIDHPAEVATSFFWSPFYTLMHNDVMKYQVKDAIAYDANGD